MKKFLFCLIAAFGGPLLLLGCASAPDVHVSAPIGLHELSSHVETLTNRSMRGRKPLSSKSRRARDYIAAHFEACGLVPWGDADGYEQPVTIGTNVIGVLPGQDEKLKDEIVIVAAHYDHIGRGYPGAADNASGVAALLEIAERLSQQEEGPKRSVCFAAFDCEERGLFGSFAFTCRDDYDTSKIAAVVNIDMLGRQFLDVMENTLFVSGTEDYPVLRNTIIESGRSERLDILPVGSDLIGPRSDHAAFMFNDFPSLFFSCGIFDDYHEKGDVAAKLNYANLNSSTQAVLATVEHLANIDVVEQGNAPITADWQELFALQKVATRIGMARELNDAEQKIHGTFLARVNELLAKHDYSLEDRTQLLRDSIKFIGPIVEGSLGKDQPAPAAEDDESDDDQPTMLIFMLDYWTKHGALFHKGYRGFIKEILDRKRMDLALHGTPDQRFRAYDVSPEDIRFVVNEDGEQRLSVLLPQVSFHGKVRSRLRGGYVNFGLSFSPHDIHGTQGEIIDWCLLQWLARTPKEISDEEWEKIVNKLPRRLRKNVVRRGDSLENDSSGRAWSLVLEAVTGKSLGNDFKAWLDWRLNEKGVNDKKEWFSDLLQSTHPEIVLSAICPGGHSIESFDDYDNLVCDITKDQNMRTDVRALAAKHCVSKDEKSRLKALLDVLNDDATIDNSGPAFLHDDTFPFRDHSVIEHTRKQYEERGKAENAPKMKGLILVKPPETMGDAVLNILKDWTGKDFGKDPAAWRKWLSENKLPKTRSPSFYGVPTTWNGHGLSF